MPPSLSHRPTIPSVCTSSAAERGREGSAGAREELPGGREMEGLQAVKDLPERTTSPPKSGERPRSRGPGARDPGLFPKLAGGPVGRQVSPEKGGILTSLVLSRELFSCVSSCKQFILG